MGWNLARYVGRVAGAGKAEYPLPMYMNAYTYGFAKADQPVHASGSPMPELFDVWRAGAPGIDMFSPDNSRDFAAFCAKYNQSGNPLFIPEAHGGLEGSARALYVFGHHDAIGYTHTGYGVERKPTPDRDLIDTYDIIAQLKPLIVEHHGNGTMSAVRLGPNDPPQKVRVGNYTLEVAFLRANGPKPPEIPTFAGAIFIATGPDEYFAAGNGVTVGFSPNTPGPPHVALATVEEGSFVNGRWVPRRRFAGDETVCENVNPSGLEGDCLLLRWPLGSLKPPVPESDLGTREGVQYFTLDVYEQQEELVEQLRVPPHESGIQRFTLYRYR
jgi:hypothetical protein